MRANLIKKGDEHLRYEIREIVEIASEIERRGVPIVWENIGDPVAKGERLPGWMKAIVERAVQDDRTYAYAPTRGEIAARQFVLDHYSDPHICTIDDVIFFNGLGEAINKIFSNLPTGARVIGPNPVYPSHATAEAMHHGGHAITYSLKLDQGARIDLEELENKVKYNESIVGILVINPNNPTGVVHPRADLERVVAIARTYNCFLLFDEIYQNMVFDPRTIVRLCDIIDDRPGISMKGVSKEIPWPGSRCGWIEVYNAERDENFRGYVNTIIISKMLEVCSTTLPQVVFPDIVRHPEYPAYFRSRIEKYRTRMTQALEKFEGSPVLRPVVPQGVFYLTVTFDTARFPHWRKLPSRTKEARLYLDEIEAATKLRRDKLFAYELLGSEGVCVVPLSGFASPFDGFRMTLLEEDDRVFLDACRRIRRAAEAFFST
jgi:aspartate/methionine/tyrosine aminotransferase